MSAPQSTTLVAELTNGFAVTFSARGEIPAFKIAAIWFLNGFARG
jgi:hypothetical protein